jgi:trans-2,3-dihydro-3-hydroxyanthranilate isomerase
MRYVTLDVFTDAPFGGNPLAVVLDADGLTPRRMQQLAAEFGYSETVFVLPPAHPGSDATLRIFTPTTELPFAGHPNVGAALALTDGAERRLRFDEGVGTVEVQVAQGQAELAAPQRYRVLGSAEPQAVAHACGLHLRDLATTPVVASAGIPFVLAQVVSVERLAQARPAGRVGDHGATGVLLHAPARAGTVRARMFAPGVGVPEDPATGSAALALAGRLATPGAAGRWAVHQGVELGRPSVLHVRADGSGRTWVAGSAVQIMAGELLVGHDGG